jgi:hypothetical protein
MAKKKTVTMQRALKDIGAKGPDMEAIGRDLERVRANLRTFLSQRVMVSGNVSKQPKSPPDKKTR